MDQVTALQTMQNEDQISIRNNLISNIIKVKSNLAQLTR